MNVKQNKGIQRPVNSALYHLLGGGKSLANKQGLLIQLGNYYC